MSSVPLPLILSIPTGAFLKWWTWTKPSSFENAIRLQFDCLARKVIGRTVKNYNKELARRAKHEISFCEIPELELNQLGVSDEYPIEFTSFDVFGTEVRVYDEKLCEAIKKLSERRRNVVLMFYFLELPDAKSQRFWIFPETLFIETEYVH